MYYVHNERILNQIVKVTKFTELRFAKLILELKFETFDIFLLDSD